jgi:toxin ParE1/3/4
MTRRKAILSPAAEADVDSIASYIAAESGLARAEAVLERIERALVTIAHMPNVGRQRQDLRQRLRSFVVSPWIIFYESSAEGGVEVRRVLDGRMNIPNHFQEP